MQKHTCEVFGQIWVVHEAMAGKLYTLQPDRNMDVIEPGEEGKYPSLNYLSSSEKECVTEQIQSVTVLL